MMNALAALQILLKLAAFFARRADRADIEKALADALENSHRARVDAAVAARDDVLSGRVQPDDRDPYRRD